MAARSDAKQSSAEVVITRHFDAPRALVFEAWTKPELLARWWGPRFFTAKAQLDVRPGGAYRIVMVAPDGAEFPMKGEYREVVRPERLVYTSDLSDHPKAWQDVIDPTGERRKKHAIFVNTTTVTFEDQRGGTLVTITTEFDSAATRDGFVKLGMREGWGLSLDKLDELVFADREITALRTFDAPRELVFRAWTDPKHLPLWWGPRGFTNTVESIDVRPGGTWKFVMNGPDGKGYKNEIQFVEIAKPERVVLDHISAPRFRMTATFMEWMGKTTVSVRMRFEDAATRDATKKQVRADEGLAQNLEKLGEYLATMV